MPVPYIAAIGSTEDPAVAIPTTETTIISMIKGMMATMVSGVFAGQLLFEAVCNMTDARAKGESSSILLWNPGPYPIEIDWSVTTHIDVECELFVFEAPSISATGTAIEIVAFDRMTLPTPTMGVWHTPTLSASGTLIFNRNYHGDGGTGDPVIGWTNADKFCMLMNTGTAYVFEARNEENTAQRIGIITQWRERDD